MMKSVMNVRNAYGIAVAYADIANDEPRCISSSHENGLYSLTLQTLFMCYDFCVDEQTGEVVGFNYQPAVDAEDAYSSYAACRQTAA